MSDDLFTRQVAAVERWLRVFHPPGSVVTVQALYGPRSAKSRCTGDLAEAARAAAEMDATGPLGVYFGLNPVRPDLAGSHAFPKDEDVVERRWLPIDVDPKRPSGTSSSEAETAAAWAVLDRCRALLDGAGMTGAVVAFAGNGWHLCYPVLLPNDPAAKELVKAVLKGLSERCGDQLTKEEEKLVKGGGFLLPPKATVGRECHDAKRIWACYGTRKNKGEATAERPHRWARVVEGEPWERERALANVATLEALLASWRFADESRKGRPQTSPQTYAAAAMRQELAAVAGAPVGDRNNRLNAGAFSLGQLVGAGALSRPEVEAALMGAGLAAGLGPAECEATITSGLDSGVQQPRDLSSIGAPKPAVPPIADGERIVFRGSEVEPKEVVWLWPGRIPLGKLTTFAGQTSQGKTFVACEIASRVTKGLPWPDGKPGGGRGGQVLFITGDDDVEDTLVPRLQEAGADLERIVFLTEKAQAGWSMAALGVLDLAIRQVGGCVQLVVIDPPTSFLHNVDDHKNAELRAVLTPFKDWAKRQGVAVVMITHVNKGGGQQVEAMARVMGSVAWVTGVRTAYMFAADPEQGERQLFLTLKNNLGPKAKALAYRVVAGTVSGRVEWLGEVETTADEAVNKPRKSSRSVVASEWMIERFRERLEWESEALFEAGKREGVSRNAIFEAKRILELPKPRKSVALDGSVSWVWWVPINWHRLANHGTNGTVDPVGEVPW